jgi:endoglucanase Acf2
MSVRTVGAGSIETAIPDGAAGPEHFNGTSAQPRVSGAAALAPVPTNDWWSSLVFDYFGGATSAPLYADPIAVRADPSGLQIGYQAAATYIDAPGLQVPDNVKYEHAFAPGLHVGLAGLNGADVTVADYGDWTVTAAWQEAGGGLQATFGHGLPYVFFSAGAGAAAVIDVMPAPPVSRVDNPAQPLVYEIGGLTGAFDGGVTRFSLPVDAGNHAADGPQVRISYDFDGDGRYERVETYRYFATDAAAGWETYTERAGLSSQSGTMADFANGSVKVELWNAIGEGTPGLRVDAPAGDSNQATLSLPFADLGTLYFRGGATADTPSVLSTQPGSVAGADVMGGAAGALWDGQGDLWYSQDGVAGVTIRGVSYGVFGPAGSQWTVTADGLRSDLGGAESFAVAVLPEKSVEVLGLFAARAGNAVTGSQANLDYDPASGSVTQSFSVTTTTGEQPLAALYRHQWLASDQTFSGHDYQSPRGLMKLGEDAGFAVTYAASPMLPVLPLLDAGAADQVRALVLADAAELAGRSIKIPFQDTYTAGKELGRLAELAKIADQIGETEARDAYLSVIKAELEDWFSAGGKQFVYNAEWGTLQGYPASFDTEKQLNDHNFHYGYFVQAAATVALFDGAWAAQDRWGGVVDLLVADVANDDRDSDLFPWLRSFDPYAGHAWASGHGDFQAGNNNESSSEALNFSAALALWGAVTGREELRDLGIGLHAVESAAVLQYWFDVDDAVFPDGFPYEAAGMIWGDGASHTTWFSDDPERIHGINLMPFDAATSLHLATRPDEILANYAEMAAESGGAPRYWKNIQWEYLALADPGQALAALQADPGYSLNEGGSGSYAQTQHWISSLAALGTLNTTVRADTPFQAVFARDGVNTYVAYNVGSADLVVHFTDGTVLSVAPHAMAALRDGVVTLFPIGGDSQGGSDPDPAPDPGPDPQPDPPPQPQEDGLQISNGRIGFAADAGTLTLAAAGGANHDGAPHAARVLHLDHVTARFDAGQTAAFALEVDAAGLADAVQLAVAYDFDGNGSVDRVETWRYFATNDTPGWETYGSQVGLRSAVGAPMQDLVNGSVSVTLWSALGNHATQVDLAASSLDLPFTAGGSPTPDPDPGPDPDPDPDPDPGPPPSPDPTGDGLMLVDGAVRFDPAAGSVTLAGAAGANHDGTPHAAASFILEQVTAQHLAGQPGGFQLLVDAGARVGDAIQAAISYDFDGNGSFDRTETWSYFATDDVDGWQAYAGSGGPRSVSGAAMQDLVGGTVKVDLWTAIGTHAIAVDIARSSLDLPFRAGGETTPPSPPPPVPSPDAGTHFLVAAGPTGLELTTAAPVVIGPADGRFIDQPHDSVVFEADGLSARYAGGNVAFSLPVDAGPAVGNGTQLRLSFDFDGDGATDRTETYGYFATDAAAGWETWSNGNGPAAVDGAFADFTGGSVTAELWNAIGEAPVTLDDGARLILPYTGWLA